MSSISATSELYSTAEVLYSSGAIDKAIDKLSEILCKPLDSVAPEVILTARILRGKIFLAHAQSVKGASAGENDQRPVSSLDCVTLCELALADAEEALRIDPKHHDALLLRCDAAVAGFPYRTRNFVVAALSVYPDDDRLCELSKIYVNTSSASATGRVGSGDLESELECPLCMQIFYEPATVACGHSFCRSCLCSALDYANNGQSSQACPLCRTPLHMEAANCPTTNVLERLIANHFPEQLKARQNAMKEIHSKAKGDNEGAEDRSSSSTIVLPLFVVGTMMPGHTYGFHVFEPRYRLMMRRVMNGSRQFGMVDHGTMMAVTTERKTSREGDAVSEELSGPEDPTKPKPCTPFAGTVMRILDAVTMPDGRIGIKCEGIDRFLATKRWEVDGYYVASGRILHDDPLPADGDQREEAEKLVSAIRTKLISKLGSRRNDVEIPTTTDAEKNSLWFCRLFLNDNQEVLALKSTDTIMRLRMVASEAGVRL